MKYASLILLFAFCAKGHCQSFLNGDFENNSASECQFNLANADYATKMSHSWAFGAGEEVDIQTFVCGYENPPSNNWFVSLSKDNEGNCDAISLELSANLQPGKEYQISYFSSALTGNTALQFGLSVDKHSFGTMIFSSLPEINNWLEHIQSFVAPNNGRYVTIRTNCADASQGWDLIDDLQLVPTLGTGEVSLENSIAVFPNPSSGQFSIATTADISRIDVYNTVGQLVKSKQTSGMANIEFELYSNGVYVLNMAVGSQMITKKLVVYTR